MRRLCAALCLSTLVFVNGCARQDAAPTRVQKVYTLETATVQQLLSEWHKNYRAAFEGFTPSGVAAGEVLNPLTGLGVSGDVLERRPLVVQLDNFYSARPQADLGKADIVYEILAEGQITRYMAVFYSTYPTRVGPIRSTRPYFVLKALEYDPYYVHVGGSMAALSDVKTYGMADIDALWSNAFYRASHKKMPHNMYSDATDLLKAAKSRQYDTKGNFSYLAFNSDFMPIDGKTADEMVFRYKKPTQGDPVGYATSYKYDKETRLYKRYTNGEAHVDENDQKQLSCTNVLVQYADTKVIDNEGRLSMTLISSGSGRYYTGGSFIDVTWAKKDARSKTQFYKLDGTPLKLNPGKTWYQIMPVGSQEEIK